MVRVDLRMLAKNNITCEKKPYNNTASNTTIQPDTNTTIDTLIHDVVVIEQVNDN